MKSIVPPGCSDCVQDRRCGCARRSGGMDAVQRRLPRNRNERTVETEFVAADLFVAPIANAVGSKMKPHIASRTAHRSSPPTRRRRVCRPSGSSDERCRRPPGSAATIEGLLSEPAAFYAMSAAPARRSRPNAVARRRMEPPAQRCARDSRQAHRPSDPRSQTYPSRYRSQRASRYTGVSFGSKPSRSLSTSSHWAPQARGIERSPVNRKRR